MTSNDFDNVRALVSESGEDSKIEVNQRALIDKILARYATPGAVYRELLQNSNDANATECEIRFSTQIASGSKIVTQAVYRNNGMPFRNQDWNRLKKIAEGNPDSSKVGFFGVGAYAMFSICEEPMVVSGHEALVFKWKGDSLWARVGKSQQTETKWTSFVLPARDPYEPPNLVEFGSFIFGNLTFLNSIKSVSVFIDNKQELKLERKIFSTPKIVKPPRSTSWWSNDGANMRTPNGYFKLKDTDGSITETLIGLKAQYGASISEAQTRLLSAEASVHLPIEMKRRIERVTKKLPPDSVSLQIVIGDTGQNSASKTEKGRDESDAKKIVDSFSPGMGNGKIFIGFKTSQSTGLGIHLSAPLIPTVEREAIDLVDPTLNKYNSELLYAGGILMRLSLEHVMTSIDKLWEEEAEDRKKLEQKEKEALRKEFAGKTDENSADNEDTVHPSERISDSGFSGFAKFMASGFKRITDIATNSNSREGDSLLFPKDRRPLSNSEKLATVIMRCFAPEQSTPEYRVGQFIAYGFESCMSSTNPPVLTQSGVKRGDIALLPNYGMETFVQDSVVRATVVNNAENYLRFVAKVPRLALENMAAAMKGQQLEEAELVLFLKWWVLFSKKHLHQSQMKSASDLLKNSISFTLEKKQVVSAAASNTVLHLKNFKYFADDKNISLDLPLPQSVLPLSILKKTPVHHFTDSSMRYWFVELTFLDWIQFIAKHPCMNNFMEYEALNLACLQFIHREFIKYKGENINRISLWMKSLFSGISCLPYDDPDSNNLLTPSDLYLPSAEIEVFSGAKMQKVSSNLVQYGISENLMKAMSVRETVSMDILFTQLENLKWNENPLPLVKFLRQSKLKDSDFQKLKTNRYLPSSNTADKLFAPSDLCLPRKELVDLGFVRVLQWPEESDAREHTPDGKFLIKLGCKVVPPIGLMVNKLNTLPLDEDKELREKILDFLSTNTGRRGLYAKEIESRSSIPNVPFLPTLKHQNIFKPDELTFQLSLMSECYTDPEARTMGFAVVEDRHKSLAQNLGISAHPSWNLFVEKLTDLPKTKLNQSQTSVDKALEIVWKHFDYLSSRTSSMNNNIRSRIQSEPIIPVKLVVDSNSSLISWKTCHQVFFKKFETENEDDLNGSIGDLFEFVKENQFLRYIGVKDEPGAEEICNLICSDPSSVLAKCGSASYKGLLKRVSANMDSISRVTLNRLKKAKCLLAQRYVKDNDNTPDDPSQNVEISLERAEGICIVDDAAMRRMFNPLCCPIESDLEEFYLHLGSKYISNVVNKYHEVSGKILRDTDSTESLKKLLKERIPLLIAPNVTHRPLVPNAANILNINRIEVLEADHIKANYVFESTKNTQSVTCCSTKTLRTRVSNLKSAITIFISRELDFFDLGSTISDLILSRSHLEDKFLFGSVLEAPLSQLRNRGFPVDRIIKVREAPKPPITPAPAPTPDTTQSEPSRQLNNIKNTQAETGSDDEGYLQILSNKFPDCDPMHIKRLLEADKSKDKLLTVSKILEKGKYPTRNGGMSAAGSRPSFTRASGGEKPISRFRKLFNRNGSEASNTGGRAGREKPNPGGGGKGQPGREAENHRDLASTLRNSINTNSRISASGVRTGSRTAPIEPHSSITHSETCEHVEGKDLVPSPGPEGRNETRNGIPVFAARRDGTVPHAYVNDQMNWRKIERFSVLLYQLTKVFSLNAKSIAIYYDAGGNTIAFNLGGGLYFNARYFIKLHYDGVGIDANAYSYWFVVFCHELAHNLQKNHGKEHGYYTESFAQQFQPALFQLLQQLQL